MADVFISWGSPDAKRLSLLSERLRSIGLSFFNYKEDMPAGSEIPNKVVSEINRAKIAIICLSKQSVEREWVNREICWCISAFLNDSIPLKTVMPVIVGEIDIQYRPSLLSNFNYSDISNEQSFENDIEKLVNDIAKNLKFERPRVIPGVLFAANYESAKQIIQNDQTSRPIVELCRAVGMLTDDDWSEKMLARYGRLASDFRPFVEYSSLLSMICDGTAEINKHMPRMPIFVHWYDPTILLGRGIESKVAREHWQRDTQLVVIDALSILHERVRSELTGVLALSAPSERRRAVLWVPPYTHHTSKLQSLILRAAGAVVQLEAPFRHWSTQPESNVAFDTATPAALSRWLNQALKNLAEPPPPNADSLAELTRNYQAQGFTSSHWFQAPNRAGL